MKKEIISGFEKKDVKIKCGDPGKGLFYFSLKKNTVEFKFLSKISEAEEIAKSGLLDYKLVEGYEAIYSPKLEKIECQLKNIDEAYYEELCCHLTDYEQNFNRYGEQISYPPTKVNIENAFYIEISIGYYSEPFKQMLKSKHSEYVFENQSKFTLKISKSNIQTHKKAKRTLSEIGNSVLFEIDTNLKIPIMLLPDQPMTKHYIGEYTIDPEAAALCDAELHKLDCKYIAEPTSYFLTANVTNDLRFYQFLLYYHCLEYFFPKYSCLHLEKPIKKVLNNITEKKINNEQIVHQILNQIRKTKKRESELDILKVLINSCFDKKEDDILNYIENRERLKQYFLEGNDYRGISPKPIFKVDEGKNKNISLNQIAKRIYNIRCAIVHKKEDSEKNKIYPTLKNFKLITHDLELLKYIAEKVIVENSNSEEK